MGGDGKPWWAIDTAAWREAFAPFHKFASISERRSTPLPPWSEADVQEFIKSDPVHGPRLSLVRQGATIASIGAVVGGLATAGLAFKYSKNVPGAVMSFLGGTAMSWTIAEEAANLGLGLYKFNCMDTNLKFLAWWGSKHP
ncbi:hypothetical protein M758_9G141600 [Ceratodon purpureus]|uniref:Succinate dehydrogenase subunit 6, mitochondrial n=1 Tax=Ceratodon purpureus TaxID=3225 RepID=A0A8T0GQ92_CERPU|nr:hypothetical protein KC19_9G090600 [Ceratodon purpureus]KAG0606451.1 hypothetical protein M758_9G141600 [Ceratodon purpureus]